MSSRWHTIVNLDGSALNMWKYWKTYNFEGVRKIWPMPSFYACKLIVFFAVFEALLQVYVPGERHIGIVSPTGNRPMYKVSTPFPPIIFVLYQNTRFNMYNSIMIPFGCCILRLKVLPSGLQKNGFTCCVITIFVYYFAYK